MQEEAAIDVVRRLKSVEGHVRGVTKMVEGGEASYADLIQQTNAIFAAIRRINALLLKDFIEERVAQDQASEVLAGDLIKAIDKVVK